MATKLKLYELPGSPNNVKARLALGYKKLAYDSEMLKLDGYPGDRSKVVAVSGQPLTPVLVHGDTVIFDSAAIIRYLDANFRQTPPLFSSDHQEMAVIEDWELYTKTKLSEPVGMIFGQVMAPKPDRGAFDRACSLMHEATGRIEQQLGKTTCLVRQTPSAADFTAAPFVNLALLPAVDPKESPIGAFFHANLRLGPGRDRTRAWVAKIMAYDPAAAR